jgi:hypothetical protein
LAHVNYIDWHITPFRAERWFEIWRPALDRALAFGADVSFVTRNIDDRQHFRQVSIWEDRADFERYWASDEIAILREKVLNYYAKPLLPNWHSLTADADPSSPSSDGTPVAETASAGE